MLLRLIHAKKFFTIYNFYLVPGHSYMPCDRHFGNIETKLRRYPVIETKGDYVAFIRVATSTGFEVVEMSSQDFLAFDVLLKYITKRIPRGANFSDARIVKYDVRFSEGYAINTTYNIANVFHKVKLMKGRQAYTRENFDLNAVNLPPKYNGPIQLKPAKVKHLKDLLPFISHTKSQYFLDILAQQDALVNKKRQAEGDSESEEDPDNNLMEYDDDEKQ